MLVVDGSQVEVAGGAGLPGIPSVGGVRARQGFRCRTARVTSDHVLGGPGSNDLQGRQLSYDRDAYHNRAS